MHANNSHPAGPDYPSQGVPTKIDRRCLPLLRMLKEWSGIKQYKMVMLLIVQEIRSHPEVVAALPPEYLEHLQGLERELGIDSQLYASWKSRATPPAEGGKGGKGKKKG